jgi:hypothetical protein
LLEGILDGYRLRRPVRDDFTIVDSAREFVQAQAVAAELAFERRQKMHAAVLASNFYSVLAVSVLFLHALFILWVVFGALLTRSRPILRWLHIVSLV